MNKETDMTMKLNPYFESTIETSNVVWSHDENSYQFNFDFTNYLCDKPFELTDGKPRILLEFLNDSNADIQIYPLEIDSDKLGQAHFIIPDKILGYVGDVKASLTIDFDDKSHDLGNFYFKMKKSAIDNKMPQLQFYVDEFEKAIKKADELNAQIKDRDLVTKPELAVVENKKADKTAVNDISLHLLDKADKTDVNAVKSEMNNKADKVAVDAKISELTTDISNTQIGMIGEFNSESELKTKYPNGEKGYAVVFENSIGYTYTYKENNWVKGNVWNGMAIENNSIDSTKIKDNSLFNRVFYDKSVNRRVLSDDFNFVELYESDIDPRKITKSGYYLLTNNSFLPTDYNKSCILEVVDAKGWKEIRISSLAITEAQRQAPNYTYKFRGTDSTTTINWISGGVGKNSIGADNIKNESINSNKLDKSFNFIATLSADTDPRTLEKNGLYLITNNTYLPAEYTNKACILNLENYNGWKKIRISSLPVTPALKKVQSYELNFNARDALTLPIEWKTTFSPYKGNVDKADLDVIFDEGYYLITNPKNGEFRNGILNVEPSNGRFIKQTIIDNNNVLHYRFFDNQGVIPQFTKIGESGVAEGETINDLKGKKIVLMGDSVMASANRRFTVADKISEKTGANVENCTFGGCMMSERISREDQDVWDTFSFHALSYSIAKSDWSKQETAINSSDLPSYFPTNYNRIKSIDFSKVDYLVVGYGTNDWTYDIGGTSVKIDNMDNKKDTKTLLGAFRYGAELIWEVYPQIKIVLVTPTYRFWLNDDLTFKEDSNEKVLNKVKLTDFVDGLEKVAKEYQIPVVNNYYELGINKYNRTNYFAGKDGTHHIESGVELIGRLIGGKLLEHY